MSEAAVIRVINNVVSITSRAVQGPAGPAGSATGDVIGPAGGTSDGQIALYDDGTGKLLRGAVADDRSPLRTFLQLYSITEVDAIKSGLESDDADIIADLLAEIADREDADDALQAQIDANEAVATTSVKGLMSASDKTKMDALLTAAQIPTGGTTGQVLAKNSGTNYDVEWVDQTGGGGGGAINDAANLGDGDGIFAQVNGDTIELKSLENGDLIALTSSSTEITIAVIIASQAESQAGLINTKGMTPLRVAEALAALGPAQSFAVPTGGTTGQVLTKDSGTNYDFSWTDLPDFGDASGPAGGTTDGQIALFDDTTGKLLRGAVSGDLPTLRTFLSVYSKAEIDSTVSGLAKGLSYQGTWNANTNSPTIPAAATGNQGYYYVVATEGATNIGGVTDWKVGDWLLSNGTTWQKLDHSDAVTSVAGLGGVITADALVTALALEIADIASLTSTLAGKASTDVATTSVAGLMSASDKTKLDGVASGANNYVHPTGDGNRHVPTTDSGETQKFLKSNSSIGGAPDWAAIAIADVTDLEDELDARALVSQALPPGGTTGQMLIKSSSDDYDTEWVDPPEGGGGGDVSGATNLGSTSSRVGIFEGEVTGTLRFKSLVAATGITISADTTEIDIGLDFATDVEAEAGASTDVVMNPLRTKEAILELGAAGVWAVPNGGSTGQLLRKASGSDYDFAWATVTLGEVNTMSNLGSTSGRQGFYAQKTALNFDMKSLVGTGLVGLTATSTEVTADVPIASQAEAEAGLINNKGMTPLRVAEAIAALAGTGGGDMTKAVYDPNDVEGDVFDVDNHVDGTTNKVFTATEKTKLAGIEALADVTDAVNVAAAIVAAASKTTPVDADTFPLIDSADSSAMKEVTWANIKATLVTYLNNQAVLTNLLSASSTATLTNKSYNAAGTGNVLTNIALTMFAANVIDTDDLLAANSDSRLATQQAAKTYIDTQDADILVDLAAETAAREDADDALQALIDDLQPENAVLTALAALTIGAADLMIYSSGANAFATSTITTQGRQLLDDTSFSAMLTTLGAQASNVNLGYLAGLTAAADRLPYFSASNAMSLTTFTSQARDLLDDTSFASMLTTLGAPPATRSIGVSGLATGGGNLTADRTITVTAASVSELWTGTETGKATVPKNFTDAHAFISVTPSAGTSTPNQNDGYNFRIALASGANVLAMMTNLKNGRGGIIWCVNNAAGSTLGVTAYQTPGGAALSGFNSGANAINILGYATNQAGDDVAIWLVGAAFS